MLFRVLDIETVSDEAAWTQGDPKWSIVPYRDLVPTKNCRPTVEQAGMAFKRDEPWPPPQANRVVAISYLDLEATTTKEEGRRYTYKSMVSRAAWGSLSDERDLIVDFGEAQTKGEVTIVTWAGRSFDLPVLALRALKHAIPWGWYYNAKSVRYRYTDEGHCDLMDVLSDYGASRSLSLNDAAHLVGLPGKTDMDGTKVGDLVVRGQDPKAFAKIARYCGHDVLQTALVFLRSRILFGYLTLEAFRASVESFKAPAKEYGLEVDWNAYLMV
jgi:hypothetical protein